MKSFKPKKQLFKKSLEMKITMSIMRLFFFTLLVETQSESPLSIQCGHAFNIMSLDLAQLFPLDVNTTVTMHDSYTSEIFVQSPCCQDIVFTSKGMACSLCSENGIKACNFTEETIEIKMIEDQECKSKTHMRYSCTSQICPPRNKTDFTEVYRPGDSTGCFETGQTYVCSKYGNWTEIPCSYKTESTTDINQLTETVNGSGVTKTPTTNKLEVSTQTDNTDVHTEANGHFSSSSNAITDQTPVSNFTVLWTESSNNSDMVTTESTIDLTSHITNDSARNETATNDFDTKEAMKALYTFLIVLGVVLFLVFIIVCVFFIRKQKKKTSISHVDYPLEYWHDKEYIDNIVEKSFSQKSSYTLNPMYDNKGYVQRYKKKDDSDFKKRKNNANENRNEAGNERPRRSNAFRTRSNGSASSNTDHPRKTKNNYTDKYIATAVGSNFYNYNPSQSEDVVKKTTDLDASIEDEIEHSRDYSNQSGTSSFRPTCKVKKQHRVTERVSRDSWDENFADADQENMYGVNYNEHLRRSLEDWSAEESDA